MPSPTSGAAAVSACCSSGRSSAGLLRVRLGLKLGLRLRLRLRLRLGPRLGTRVAARRA